MARGRIKQKGIVLFIVVATIFIVILLGNILLSIITSHARLTHHQVSRIQAYYAAMAGVNYAYNSLRTGSWPLPASGGSNTYNLNEPDLPTSVTNVAIVVADRDFAGCDPPGNTGACIYATSTYTYTP